MKKLPFIVAGLIVLSLSASADEVNGADAWSGYGANDSSYGFGIGGNSASQFGAEADSGTQWYGLGIPAPSGTYGYIHTGGDCYIVESIEEDKDQHNLFTACH